ncbi:ExbD/TolR family protein [Rubinisphaera margarita]|uniref:ExbD/TolR family protein n=1 Tax=Rubinisphaera margarita TaxID=2909586 RepID=UPI0021BCBC96|nr:biopolymer transporter ExbD [Rubinisphaera margarita]
MKGGFLSGTTSAKRRSSQEADLDITPMIDVTFLLLIFFMVTSTMQSTPAIDLPVAHHGVGVSRSENVIVSVIDQDGIPLLMAGEPPAPEMTLDEITQHVRQQVDLGKSGIIVKASGTIPSGYIKQLTQRLQALGEVRFHYAVSEQNPSSPSP